MTASASFPVVLQVEIAGTSPFREHVTSLEPLLSGFERRLRAWLPRAPADAVLLFRRRNRFDAVVTTDYRTAVGFGLLRKLFGSSAVHLVKELYVAEPTLASRWKTRVFRLALARCECIITNSSGEIDVYSRWLALPRERFRFLPWPSNIASAEDGIDGGALLAVGRSLRDWPALFAAASQIDGEIVVVAEARDVRGLTCPPNVILRCDLPRADYLAQLRRARAVILPLLPTVRSVGQAAALEAMAYGKALLVAGVSGIADYVTDEKNGLLYRPGDVADLARQARRLIADEPLRLRLGREGQAAIRERFNKARYAETMLALCTELTARHSPR